MAKKKAEEVKEETKTLKKKDLAKELGKALKAVENNLSLTDPSEHEFSVLLGIKDKLELHLKELDFN